MITMTDNSCLMSLFFLHTPGQITDEESLFTYPPGLSVSNFSNQSHIPPFADEIEVDQAVADMCGDDPECVFDSTVTGNAEIGMSSLTIDSNNTDDLLVAGKISGRNIVYTYACDYANCAIGSSSQMNLLPILL